LQGPPTGIILFHKFFGAEREREREREKKKKRREEKRREKKREITRIYTSKYTSKEERCPHSLDVRSHRLIQDSVFFEVLTQPCVKRMSKAWFYHDSLLAHLVLDLAILGAILLQKKMSSREFCFFVSKKRP